jgi:hypothetical protein
MTFSTRATTPVFAAPDFRLRCSHELWTQTLSELARRGEDRHEAGAFLLGDVQRQRRDVREVVYYDELDSAAYDTGACVLYGDAFARLWAIARQKQLTIVGDVHTHFGRALQSFEDRTNPMVARAGHIALIVPYFARPPVLHEALGVYEYRGNHEWIDHSGVRARRFFQVWR